MGKTKQVREKRFDRNIEISAPILDPEIIKAIHTPPKDKKLDIRHGGFKALLSDLNSQDSTDELTPITENYLPSYIGISCAVSGYSNYSSYNRKTLDDANDAKTTKSVSRNSKLLSTTPNRSQTNSPSATRVEQHHINHVTIDKSHINSADQERKELTEKLVASATERRQSPSPIPPTEDDRHHGAYVGARYFPMPEPSKLVHKHIPLLGIDDDQDPDEFVPEDVNKVEKKIASLYGEDFVEDWRESMSHKAKKETHDEPQQADSASKNLKDLVTLKPTPPKAPEPEESTEVIDVPVPNVKVLAGVEKHFLNRLLTDENPPMPKSPSPQPMSPVNSPKISPKKAVSNHTTPEISRSKDVLDSPIASPVHWSPKSQEIPVSPSPKLSPEQSPIPSPTPAPCPTDEIISISPKKVSFNESPMSASPRESPLQELSRQSPALQQEPNSPVQPSDSIPENNFDAKDEIITIDDQFNVKLEEPELIPSYAAEPSPSPSSPDSQRSKSTVEEAHGYDGSQPAEDSERHIEFEIRAQSPVNNESSPVKISHDSIESSDMGATTQEPVNLVSFSPEPSEIVSSENNNNNNNNNEHDDSVSTELNRTDLNNKSESDIKQDLLDLSEQLTPTNSDSHEQQSIRDGKYFLTILENEESFIRDQVKVAESKLAEQESTLDEESVGKIRSAIGKANLLVNKKCNQFRELCEKSLTNDASEQYAVLNDDLAGFWDMISIQISDVRKSFENL